MASHILVSSQFRSSLRWSSSKPSITASRSRLTSQSRASPYGYLLNSSYWCRRWLQIWRRFASDLDCSWSSWSFFEIGVGCGQHLGEGVVRTIATDATEGVVRWMESSQHWFSHQCKHLFNLFDSIFISKFFWLCWSFYCLWDLILR